MDRGLVIGIDIATEEKTDVEPATTLDNRHFALLPDTLNELSAIASKHVRIELIQLVITSSKLDSFTFVCENRASFIKLSAVSTDQNTVQVSGQSLSQS